MKKYLLILICSTSFAQWSGLQSNQIPTFTNLQTSGFSLNAGQSHVTSNECLTKAQALAKYNLSASAMSAYASNQLVPKSAYVANTPPVTCYSLIDIARTPSGNVQIACYNHSQGIFVNVAADAESLAAADTLYTNCSSKPPASSGWYSDGSIVRYWNGTSFTNSAICY